MVVCVHEGIHWTAFCCLLSDQSACFIPARLLCSDQLSTLVWRNHVFIWRLRQTCRYVYELLLEKCAYCVECDQCAVDGTPHTAHNDMIIDELWEIWNAETLNHRISASKKKPQYEIILGANWPKRGLKDSAVIYNNKILTTTPLVTMWKTEIMNTILTLRIMCSKW